ncbi:DUF7002 family protein [Actinopolymorpha pittospori]|uniref:Uncharacterized protein n=1 Tax=Actinopolymorpha pittospori TaxID=648752 RepID=A0A927MYK1_9ACTN|nr:hypothetical protein [Actinopolymorpha pittospori]MBE1608699.1 hypothetical protein [Actinopolymorpha pittospori]
MDIEELVAKYPILFHMAEDDTWPSIARHGLLSTNAIVELYRLDHEQADAIVGQVRRRSVTLSDPKLGSMTIRDQLPLKFLDGCLTASTTPRQFLDALNGRVFFWVTEARLLRLLRATQYRKKRQTILRVDTARLMERHEGRVQLAPYNTGSMHVPTAPKRGADVFVDVASYPYGEWRRRRGKAGDALVELTVPHSVPDIVDCLLSVESWSGGVCDRRIWGDAAR